MWIFTDHEHRCDSGVGAPLLDTQLLNMKVQIQAVSLAKWGTHSILMDPPKDPRVPTSITFQACLRPKQHNNKHQTRLLTVHVGVSLQ